MAGKIQIVKLVPKISVVAEAGEHVQQQLDRAEHDESAYGKRG
jgi:hypothetical protein